MMARSIYAMHDPGPWFDDLARAGCDGWCVYTEAIGHDPNDRSGRDYRHEFITPIVRLNNAYGSGGTIPLPQDYDAFAQRCANFVAASQGCKRWIIGNEIAMEWDWPDNQVITLANYIDCFRRCRQAIKTIQPDAEVIPQAPAPWNATTPDAPDWVGQLGSMLSQVDCDGIAIHAYSHGYNPSLITDETKMGEPYAHRYYHFPVYRQFMEAIPEHQRDLPVYLTETNGDGPWSSLPTGWPQEMYAEIARWNATPGNQQILCAALFRWQPDDKVWDISTKTGALDDFRQALNQHYQHRYGVAGGSPRLPDTGPLWAGLVTAMAGLNVRETPGGEILGALAVHEPVHVFMEQDGWLLISNRDGLIGWSHGDHIRRFSARDMMIDNLAEQHHVDTSLVRAVLAIESNGAGFDAKGRLKIRFENHLWRRQVNKATFDAHWRIDGPQPWEGHLFRATGGAWVGVHSGSDREWECFELACQYNAAKAIECISMGAPQILGMHWHTLGFASPAAMLVAFRHSEDVQIDAMFRLMAIMHDPQGVSALVHLRSGNLLAFAQLYNGMGQAERYRQMLERELGNG